MGDMTTLGGFLHFCIKRASVKLVLLGVLSPCVPSRPPARQRRPGPPGVTGLHVLGREPGPGESPRSRVPHKGAVGWMGRAPLEH